MDVFSWSLPFVAEKSCEVLNSILSYSVEKANTEGKSDFEDSSGRLEYNRKEQERVEKQERLYSVIKDKVNAVSKMRKVYRVIREENDNIVKLKALSPSGRLPAGILSKGSEAIAEALSSFERARNADLENMKLPEPLKRKSSKKKGSRKVARRRKALRRRNHKQT